MTTQTGLAHVDRGINNIIGEWYHVEAGAAAPAEATHVVLAKSAYEKMRADAEDNELGRGRLRLWLEFIHLNCASAEAKEFAGAALNGAHVPEGFA